MKIGFSAIAMPISRREIDYAEGATPLLGLTAVERGSSRHRRPTTPFATKLRDAGAIGCSPGRHGLHRFAPSRRCAVSAGQGDFVTWAHMEAEGGLDRMKDEQLVM